MLLCTGWPMCMFVWQCCPSIALYVSISIEVTTCSFLPLISVSGHRFLKSIRASSCRGWQSWPSLPPPLNWSVWLSTRPRLVESRCGCAPLGWGLCMLRLVMWQWAATHMSINIFFTVIVTTVVWECWASEIFMQKLLYKMDKVWRISTRHYLRRKFFGVFIFYTLQSVQKFWCQKFPKLWS